MKPLPPEYILHFVVDPLNHTRDICVRNMWELTRAPSKLTYEMISQIRTPMFMAIGEKDQVVDNSASHEIFDKCVNISNKVKYVYEDQDHMIFHERDQVKRITSDII